jgi:hypothetical protein
MEKEMSEKKNSAKTQTKAGMLGKSDSGAASEKDKSKSGDKTENSPKMSKNKA